MSIKEPKKRIAAMYSQLNKIIEDHKYDLQNEEVQNFSRKLDAEISSFNKQYDFEKNQ